MSLLHQGKQVTIFVANIKSELPSEKGNFGKLVSTTMNLTHFLVLRGVSDSTDWH